MRARAPLDVFYDDCPGLYNVVQLGQNSLLAGLKNALADTHAPSTLNYFINYIVHIAIHIKSCYQILYPYSIRHYVLLKLGNSRFIMPLSRCVW